MPIRTENWPLVFLAIIDNNADVLRSICLCDRVLATDEWNWYYTLSRQRISKETIQKVILGFLNRTRIANNALLLYTLCWVNKLMRKPSSHIVRIISQCVDYHKETWTIIVYIGRFHYVAPSGVSYNMHPYINCTKACTYYSGIMRVMYCYISQHWGSDLRGHYAVVLAGARAISRDIFYV
jgi:hypothetical protein